jgi:hypothetical protein
MGYFSVAVPTSAVAKAATSRPSLDELLETLRPAAS